MDNKLHMSGIKRKSPASASAVVATTTGSSNTLKQGSLFSFFKKKEPVTSSPSAVVASSCPTTKLSASMKPSATKVNANTTTKDMAKVTVTNSLWKQVQVGDKLRIWWPDDRKYYAIQVLRVKGSTFHVRYDDGESEWTDLSTEKFEFLKKTTEKKRRQIDDDDDDNDNDNDDEEYQFDDQVAY